MDQAPIDIRYGELLSWLESRYLIPKDWAKRLELIGVKKSEFLDAFFLKDTPEMKKLQETFKLFKGNSDSMTYNDVMRLNTMLLKTEEAKSKTLFGNYNSPLIKDSNLLVGIYNKNNMHLCESSKLIIQYIGYEIPNLDKNTQYNERTINDYQSKINEKSSQVERNNQKIKELFKRYNIKETDKANDIALALINRLDSLEKMLKEIETKLTHKSVTKALDLYQNFYRKIYNQEMEKVDPNILKVLKRINKEGDYLSQGKESNGKNKYSMIKSKLDEYKQKYENLDIQADIEAQMWNFKLVGGDVSQNSEEKSITALLNPTSRRQLKNDLNEVLIFVTHRLNQINNKDEVNLSMYQSNLREISLEQTSDVLQDCKKFLTGVISSLENPDLVFLLSIFDDEKNIKLILNSFEILRTENKKLLASNVDLNNKIDEIKKEISENGKKIAQFKKDAKLIKKQMEKFMTDSLKRKITVIGDINLIS
jgi:hypothetical protein